MADTAPNNASSYILGRKPNTPWSILLSLYEHRDHFADVEIRCLDGKRIQAHKAVLASRERFFADIFFPQAQQQAHPRARRAGRATFAEESQVLQSIIEYLYTGVIVALESGPPVFPDADGRLWIKTLMWCSRHDVASVFDYVHIFVIKRSLTTACAAELLALVAPAAAGAAGEAEATTTTSSLRKQQITELHELALSSFESVNFTEDVFAPLSRTALKTLLSSGALTAKNVDIIRAVAWWASNSAWVRNNVDEGMLNPENMKDITGLLDPVDLTGPEFGTVQGIFPVAFRTEIWRAIALKAAGRAQPQLEQMSRRISAPNLTRASLQAISNERSCESMVLLESFAQDAREKHTDKDGARRSATLKSSRILSGDDLSAAADGVARMSLGAHGNTSLDTLTEETGGSHPVPGRPSTDEPSGVPPTFTHFQAPEFTKPDFPNGAPAAGPGAPGPPWGGRAGSGMSAYSDSEGPEAGFPPNPAPGSGPAPVPNPHRGSYVPDWDFPDSGPQRAPTPAPTIESAEPEAIGNIAPAIPAVSSQHNLADIRKVTALAARSVPGDPLSAFHYGSGMQIQEVAPFVTLVSSDTTHHQSMLYKVGITSGRLRWSLEVVRPCDMLWMGVSAEFNLDTSQWAARYSGVWMASEESSCLEHIRQFTRLYRDNPDKYEYTHPAHVGLTRLQCCRCIVTDQDLEDDGWKLVIAELRIEHGLGELWMDVNGTGMQLVFHSLPTDKPLYPVVSVINAMQVKFTHLE